VTISSWLHFGRPAPPGRGSAAGRKLLAPPYNSQRAVFASPLSAFFTYRCAVSCRRWRMKCTNHCIHWATWHAQRSSHSRADTAALSATTNNGHPDWWMLSRVFQDLETGGGTCLQRCARGLAIRDRYQDPWFRDGDHSIPIHILCWQSVLVPYVTIFAVVQRDCINFKNKIIKSLLVIQLL